MKIFRNVLIFIIFLIYTILIFWVNNYFVLGSLAILHIMLMLVLKVSVRQAINNIVAISIFILFTIVINIFAMSFNEAILIGVRLTIVCNATFIFSKIETPYQIAEVIQTLLVPLKIVKVNPENIAIIISIAIAFIPILTKEMRAILYSLKSKGLDTSIIGILKNVNLVLSPLLVSIIRRVSQVEYALKAKAYDCDL